MGLLLGYPRAGPLPCVYKGFRVVLFLQGDSYDPTEFLAGGGVELLLFFSHWLHQLDCFQSTFTKPTLMI